MKFDKTVSLKHELNLKDNAESGFAMEVDLGYTEVAEDNPFIFPICPWKKLISFEYTYFKKESSFEKYIAGKKYVSV